MGTASYIRGRFWAADRAKAARNRAPAGGSKRPASAKSVGDGAHGAAITEPHPRYGIASPPLCERPNPLSEPL